MVLPKKGAAMRASTAVMAAGLTGALVMPAQATAAGPYFRVLSVSGQAVADVQRVAPPCRESDTSGETAYVVSGRYDVRFNYDRGQPTSPAIGSWRTTDDGTRGPDFGGLLGGRSSTTWSEEIVFTRGLGAGLGCETVRQERCEGTYASGGLDKGVYVRPRGPEFRQSFRRGVLVEWPTVYFGAEGGPCEYYGGLEIAQEVWPRVVAKVSAFRPGRRVRRFAHRVAVKGTSTRPSPSAPAQVEATQQWTYSATMRIRRSTR